AEAAAAHGMRLGVWGGPDGFGDTEESAEARHEQMVKLCRDFHFALFKFDGVCGELYPQNHDRFVRMMKECRRYSPDLILLNHRLWLGEEGMQHATTFLWEGRETYVDIHIGNSMTAPHHRGYLASFGNTPSLLRLTEDHGVCLSSYMDYFEDELIVQAFGRSLILAPEIYGNPWLLRDDEQARLARIYNLHRRWRDILVNGMLLPGGEHYPPHAVARGSASHRFLCAGNTSWKTATMRVRLDLEIGLAPCETVSVSIHHPYEEYVGEFAYGAVVDLPIAPFRSTLVEICDAREADVMLKGCRYEVLHESDDGKIDRVKIVASDGSVAYSDGKPFAQDVPAFDNTIRAPKELAMQTADAYVAVPENAVQQLETALFVQNHDALEARELIRSGETAIPQVKAARDAFFNQATYRLRGCESRFAFDGNENTFFDGLSKRYFGGFRMDGGCLRVDFGDVYAADEIRFTYFDIDVPTVEEKAKQTLAPLCTYSTDLGDWKETTIETVSTVREETIDMLVHKVHNITKVNGRRRMVTYRIDGAVRYFKMPVPIDHIYEIALFENGKQVSLVSPRANNLLPADRAVRYAKELKVAVDAADWREGCYLSVGLEGTHGVEGAYALLEVDGKLIAAPDRAPGYNSNIWEYPMSHLKRTDHHYTYYFPVDRAWCGRELTVRVLGVDDAKTDFGLSVYLCDKNAELDGVVVEL
ncbi:MAG: hypothetical protein IKU55_02115, partial [Clostridia bacterium]|nr:hypothetical protein [Clostridia bacterium]